MLKHIHLSEVYNAGGVAKAAPPAFSLSTDPSVASSHTCAVLSHATQSDVEWVVSTVVEPQPAEHV
ncbi:MAG TPA: hypothetical protein D7I11_06195 [Candidatus Poseidoniales archaeon]|nr:MAG TPA: hypothetical protein D7I11_06195 [Candidatus Poseidoniales archaeon]